MRSGARPDGRLHRYERCAVQGLADPQRAGRDHTPPRGAPRRTRPPPTLPFCAASMVRAHDGGLGAGAEIARAKSTAPANTPSGIAGGSARAGPGTKAHRPTTVLLLLATFMRRGRTHLPRSAREGSSAVCLGRENGHPKGGGWQGGRGEIEASRSRINLQLKVVQSARSSRSTH